MAEAAAVVSVIADALTIVASAIAIYIFCTKRRELSTALRLVIDYAHQLSLSEVKEKLERLNDYNANNPEGAEAVTNIIHEIIGQIRGNAKLRGQFAELLLDLEKLVSSKSKLTEPRKRRVVAELRERLRHVNVENLDGNGGEKS